METRKNTKNANTKERVQRIGTQGYVHATEFAKAVTTTNGTMDKS